MSAASIPDEQHAVACPFCGLVCDDLVVAAQDGRLRVRANGCRISTAAFEREPCRDEPRVAGRAATLAAAAAEAARLLQGARQPLFAGLGTDVAGARAIARLAERCGGVVDHMNSAAGLRDALVLQDSGWINTTLTEVRNRADLLVVAGSDVAGRFPRFFERCIANRETMFGDERRCEVVFVGKGPPDGALAPGIVATVLPCDESRMHEAFGVLRALVAGRTPRAAEAAGVPLPALESLAERMQAARYGVIAWAAADLAYSHAELTVQALCELVKELGRTTRFCGLPLSSGDGDVTFESVHLWHCGFGSRTSYGHGVPEYDPYHLSTARLLESGTADVLVWVSSFSESRTPPATAAPTVVLGRAGMTVPGQPAVFVPVGTPGIDHAGHLFRTDRVVALPLARLRHSELPSVAQVVEAIEEALSCS
jgi:formylmethanofuran dehydrogenase subunit B